MGMSFVKWITFYIYFLINQRNSKGMCVVGLRGAPLGAGICLPLIEEFKKPNYEDWQEEKPEVVEAVQFLHKIYSECGATKTCITPDADETCILAGNCMMGLTYGNIDRGGSLKEDEIVIELIGFSPTWIAIAFPPDPSTKKDAYQIECVDENTAPKLILWEAYYNFLQSNLPRRDIHESHALARLIDSNAVGGVLYCKFYIKKYFINPPTRFYFDRIKYKPLFSRGGSAEFGQAGRLTYSAATCTLTPEWNKPLVDFGIIVAPSTANRKMLKNHAICMTLAFMVAIPIGGFHTRYFKSMFLSEKSYWELPAWLWVHVGMEAFAIACMFKGLEYSSQIKELIPFEKQFGTPTVHGRLGLALCALHFAFFIFFIIFRTKTAKPYRWTVRLILHQFVGHFASINSLYLINNLKNVAFSGVTCFMAAGFEIWSIFFLFMHCIMSMYFSWIEGFAKLFNKYSKITNVIRPIDMLLHSSFTTTRQPFHGFRICLFFLFCSSCIFICLIVIFSLDNSVSQHYCQDKWYSFLI